MYFYKIKNLFMIKAKHFVIFTIILFLFYALYFLETQSIKNNEYTNIIGYWQFDEGKGTVIYDNSTQKIKGYFKGHPRWTKGIINGALVFNPVDGYDYIELMNTPLLDKVQEGCYSISAWFKPLSVPKGKTSSNYPSYGIIMKAGYHIGLSYSFEKKFAVNHFIKGNKWAGTVSVHTFEPGIFYHITGVVDRKKGISQIYINGLLDGEYSFKPGAETLDFGSTPWRIGIGSPQDPVNHFAAHGVIDDVMIFNTALDEVQISEFYQKNVPVDSDIIFSFNKTGEHLKHKAYGILESISENKPDDKYVKPLKPSLIRHGKIFLYERANRLGAKFMFILTDEYAAYNLKWSDEDGFDKNSRWPGDNGDWNNWDSFLLQKIKYVQKKGYDNFIWEVWNEPDQPRYWKRSWDQFLKVYKHSVDLIRSNNPNSLITGPSFSVLTEKKMRSFLEFAKKNNVLPDILNWHELSNSPEDIIYNVNMVKKLLKNYRISIDRIMIPEIINPNFQFSPGLAVSYIVNIHAAGVEAAAKSCWSEAESYSSISNCFNDSLNGLLDPVNGKPRAIWWVFAEYAKMSGSIIPLTYKNELLSIDGIASYDSHSNTAFFLLGRYKWTNGSVKDVLLSLKGIPENLIKNQKVHAVIKKIPYGGPDNLKSPIVAIDEQLEIKNSELNITLPRMDLHDVFFIVLSP